ncbi:hypothetical protein [Burkholderia mayonis]|uniref:Uncharacterized protein n=1 Tax=Burkholderia mayonis TaxID=1385591 RepID=A0A1B4G2Q2_9BURK|nr:hypothetical protein [Burkholderia mayonis]AOJ10216.1 hypothetical protein WS71_23635 [Burkholderia mayonis]KVE53802.1 hypothetical protein WS71_07130 [Burkholderia mayonis]
MDHYDFDVLIGATLPANRTSPETELRAEAGRRSFAGTSSGDRGSHVEPAGTQEGRHDAR